jgi:hypothetical protein
VRGWLRIDTRSRAITFLCACSLAGLIVLLASGGQTWRLYGMLPERALNSDRLRIVHEIAARWEAAPPDILMLGGSQLRELMPEDEYIATALSSQCGRSISVFNAATSSQPLESSWAMADLMRRPGQLVVINLSIWRVLKGQKIERLARTLLPIPNSRNMPAGVEQVQMPWEQARRSRLGILFADAVTSTGLRGARIERAGPFASYQHSYRDVPQPAELKSIEARFQAARLRPIADREVERNVRGFIALAQHLRADKGDVVFLLTPASAEVVDEFIEFRELETRASMLLREAAPLLDLSDGSSLASTDFADTLHLTTHGRTQLWPALNAYLLSHLPDCSRP